MKSPPVIVVQLVHIQGPLKGEIQEFSDQVISIGRDPSGHVHFPKDLTIISRNHAEITREGNRFKLIDQSTNGTLVNGKMVKEAYLKDGDVLTFAEGGPKVSFLTKMMEDQPEIQSVSPPGMPPEIERVPQPQMQDLRPASPPPKPPEMPSYERPHEAQAQPQPGGHEPEIPIQRVQAPLIIQYGPTLRSFKELPVSIGKNPGCDFVLDHTAILDRHAQIFFSQGQYWAKDLTGQKMLSINGQPVHLQAPLNPDDSLAFSPHQGPIFRFLGGGRLAEIEEPAPEQPVSPSHDKEEMPPRQEPTDKSFKGAKAMFKKFLRR